MDKQAWALHHGFSSEDMIQIELTLSYGQKITAIFEKPLNYETVKYSS